MKHSPGPWELYEPTPSVSDANGNVIYQVHWSRAGEGNYDPLPDARLIAAAPELLEALIGLVNCTNDPISAENLSCSGPPCPMTDGDCVTCCARALLDRLSATEPPREP